MITKLLGNPTSKLVNQIENEKNKEFVLQLPKREGKKFEDLFKLFYIQKLGAKFYFLEKPDTVFILLLCNIDYINNE